MPQWRRRAEPDWERLLTRAAKLYLARCAKAGYAPALDLTLHVVGYEDRAVRFSFTVRLDDGTMGFDLAVGAETRSKASYTVDERLLFCLITGLLNWNAMEASGLLGLSRTPDVYDPGPASFDRTFQSFGMRLWPFNLIFQYPPAHPRESGDPGFPGWKGSSKPTLILHTAMIQSLVSRLRGNEREEG